MDPPKPTLKLKFTFKPRDAATGAPPIPTAPTASTVAAAPPPFSSNKRPAPAPPPPQLPAGAVIAAQRAAQGFKMKLPTSQPTHPTHPPAPKKPKLEPGGEVRATVGRIQQILDRVQQRDRAGWFRQAVDEALYPQYKLVVKRPMHFSLIRQKLQNNQYTSWDEVQRDFDLMFDNAMTFTPNVREPIHQMALNLKGVARKMIEQARRGISASAAKGPPNQPGASTMHPHQQHPQQPHQPQHRPAPQPQTRLQTNPDASILAPGRGRGRSRTGRSVGVLIVDEDESDDELFEQRLLKEASLQEKRMGIVSTEAPTPRPARQPKAAANPTAQQQVAANLPIPSNIPTPPTAAQMANRELRAKPAMRISKVSAAAEQAVMEAAARAELAAEPRASYPVMPAHAAGLGGLLHGQDAEAISYVTRVMALRPTSGVPSADAVRESMRRFLSSAGGRFMDMAMRLSGTIV